MFEKEQCYQVLCQFTQEDECCLNCGKGFTDIISLFVPRRDLLCMDCRQHLPAIWRTKQVRHLVVQYLYDYDDVFSSYLYRFKGIGEERFHEVFLSPKLSRLKKMFQDYIVVRIPSWHEDDERRGFNHVEVLFEGIGKKLICPFVKKRNEKQASKSKEERTKIDNVIELIQGIDISWLQREKVLVVDDVMTTGNTLFHAIALLNLDAPAVFVVAMHPGLSK